MIPATLFGPRGLLLRVGIAIGRVERARGLLGLPPIASDEGMLLPRARSVHTFGLTSSITVVQLRRDLSVRRATVVRPRRVVLPAVRTRHIVELDARTDVRPGDRFRLEWGDGSDQRIADDPEHQERCRRQQRDRDRGGESGPGGERDRAAAAGVGSKDAEQFEDVPHPHACSSAAGHGR